MPLPFMLSTPPAPQPLNMKGHSSVEGKAFRFKPRAQWSATARSEFGLADLFFLHPVFVLRKLGRDSVEVVSVTSTRDAAVDPRNYLQIATPIWMKKQTGPKLNLVNTPGYVTQLPKTSWVRLDKCREVPFEILQEWRRDDGVQFMLRKESTEKLYRFVRRAEAGWIDDRKEAGELTLPRTPPRTPSTFALYEMPGDSYPEIGNRFPGWKSLYTLEGDSLLGPPPIHCKRQGPFSKVAASVHLDADALKQALRELESRVDKLHNALSLLQIVTQTGCQQDRRAEAWEIV
jgi:hypothetical protein